MEKVKQVKWKRIHPIIGLDSRTLNVITEKSTLHTRESSTKPDWISAINTEVFVKNKKNSLLIVVGESWSYGENFQGVQSGLGNDSLTYRINNSFAGHCAKALDSDLLLSAVPGNCNQNMIHDLDRLLEEYAILYEEIKVIFQLTSPGRDQSKIEDWYKTLEHYNTLYSETQTLDKKLSDVEWFKMYDEMMLKELNRVITSHTNVEGLVWKNFNPFMVDFATDSCTIVICPWVRLTAQMHGSVFELPVINEAGWWQDHYPKYKNVENDSDYIMKQLDNLESSNTLLRNSSLNGFHPNEEFHMLWATYLLGKTEWTII